VTGDGRQATNTKEPCRLVCDICKRYGDSGNCYCYVCHSPQSKKESSHETDVPLLTSRRFQVAETELLIKDAYQPLINFVENKPTPLLRCSDHIRNLTAALPGVQHLDDCIVEASRVAQLRLHMPQATLVNDPSMVFAIVMFTFDTCLIKTDSVRERNFYFILNRELRKREPKFLKEAHGYLYYLMTGLSRLPPVALVVYRGIDAEKADDAKQAFKVGQRLQWSSFSSTTKDVNQAKHFAMAGGLILRIQLLPQDSYARDISELSAIRQEAEVLLLPNISLIVTNTNDEIEGIPTVDLMEISQEVVVDF
jgi:hypothetical protein